MTRRRKGLARLLLSALVAFAGMAQVAAASPARGPGEFRAEPAPVAYAAPSDAGIRAGLAVRPDFAPRPPDAGALRVEPLASSAALARSVATAASRPGAQPPTSRRYARACHRDDGEPPA